MEHVGEATRRWALGHDLAVCHGVGLFNRDRWREIVGDDLADAGRPLRLERGRLVIEVDDLSGSTLYRYSCDAVADLVNEAAGDIVVRSVSLRRTF